MPGTITDVHGESARKVSWSGRSAKALGGVNIVKIVGPGAQTGAQTSLPWRRRHLVPGIFDRYPVSHNHHIVIHIPSSAASLQFGRDAGISESVVRSDSDSAAEYEKFAALLRIANALQEAHETILTILPGRPQAPGLLVKTADWVVDPGPEGDDGGGTIVAQGTPEQVAQVKTNYTGAENGSQCSAVELIVIGGYHLRERLQSPENYVAAVLALDGEPGFLESPDALASGDPR